MDEEKKNGFFDPEDEPEEVEFELEEAPEEVEFELEDPEDVEFELEDEEVHYRKDDEEDEAEEVEFELEDEPEEVIFELASDGKVIEVRFDRSFTARIIQTERAKRYYSELKNYCESYLMKSRISWKADTFHVGRTTCLMMKVRGKTLTLYLALDPASYDNAIYHHRDVSNLKTYEKCPMMVRVRSDLALRKAKALIDDIAAREALSMNETESVDYVAAYPYEDTDSLIERKLIKRIEHKLSDEDSAQIANDLTLEAQEEQALENEPIEEDDGTEEALFAPAPKDVRDPKLPEAYASLCEEGRYVTLQKYVRGFVAKMKQGPYERKDRYAAVKSALLALRGVKVRSSFVGETFAFGRQPLLKSRIRGKTLFLYFALNPDDYPISVYHQQYKGDVKSFADTPMMVRVKSEQALARALQLVDALEKRYSLKKGEKRSFRSEYRYEDTEALVHAGLIKLKFLTVPKYEADRLLGKKG